MAEGKGIVEELSFRRTVGFACNQAFIFFLFYMGLSQSVQLGGLLLKRMDLGVMLLFMVAGFFALSRFGARLRQSLLSRPALLAYALLAATASLYPLGGLRNAALGFAAFGVLGACLSFLLTAWGRSFGMLPTKNAVSEVFLGSLAAAFICLIFSLCSVPEILLLMRAFPIAGAAWIDSPAESGEDGASRLAQEEGRAENAAVLSLKVMVGTLCFGIAAGFMETFANNPASQAYPGYQVALIIFAAFLMGALSLLLSDGFGKGAALNKSYRLAVFIMVAGALLVPLGLSTSVYSGESVVLAGYLGLEAVLICLFLIVAKMNGEDGVQAFCRGFMYLFAGELVGVLAANLIAGSVPGQAQGIAVALAGALALLAYVFLFTERDFDSLSKIVSETDDFSAVCESIVASYGLSKREAEVLPFALRGRTSSRIAESFGVSKSTVDTHLRRIYSKTGVHSRQELIDLGESIPR